MRMKRYTIDLVLKNESQEYHYLIRNLMAVLVY